MSSRRTTPVTPVRLKYLRDRALSRARCDEAFDRGYAIDPESSEQASHELLIRSILPHRRPRITDRIIAVDEAFMAEYGNLEPADRWERAVAQRAATGLRSRG